MKLSFIIYELSIWFYAKNHFLVVYSNKICIRPFFDAHAALSPRQKPFFHWVILTCAHDKQVFVFRPYLVRNEKTSSNGTRLSSECPDHPHWRNSVATSARNKKCKVSSAALYHSAGSASQVKIWWFRTARGTIWSRAKNTEGTISWSSFNAASLPAGILDGLHPFRRLTIFLLWGRTCAMCRNTAHRNLWCEWYRINRRPK